MTVTAASAPNPTMNVEPHEPCRYQPTSDRLILAAVERAERHSRNWPAGVTHSDVAEHLGFERTGATTRKLVPQLVGLLEDGSLSRRRRGSGMKDGWALTARGRRQLAAARRHGHLEPLPESPQHREWRHAQEEAGGRLPAIKSAATDVAEEALGYIASSPERRPPGSAHVFGLAKRLALQFGRLGTATYCLQDWTEPDDAHPDPHSMSVVDLTTADPQ